MKIEYRKKNNIDLWVVFCDGERTTYTLSKESFGSSIYYLLRQGKKVIRRYLSVEECQEDMKTMFLDKAADRILKEG